MKKYISILLAGIMIVSLIGCRNEEVASTGPSDDTEPNDEIASAYEITVGEPVTAYIYPEGDVDFFKLTTSSTPLAGGVLVFSLTSFPIRPNMTIYNHDKSEICAHYDDTEGSNLHIWVDAKPATIYYVKVNAWIKKSSTNSYVLTVNYTDVNDSNEPDNDFANASTINLDSTYSAYLFTGEPTNKDDYEDYYKITTSASGKINARLENVPTDIRPEMSIYNAVHSQIIYGYDNTYGANLTVITDDIVDAGDYYIVVKPWMTPTWHNEGDTAPNHATNPYTIKIILE